jgi:glycosyltransferase involved in cell wall biosynthesis
MHLLTLTPFYPNTENDASGCFIAEPVGELERLGVQSSVIAVHPGHRSHPGLDGKSPAATLHKYFSFPGNPGLSTAGRFLYAGLKSCVKRIHTQRPISLIHAHGALPCGHAAMLLSRDLGVPFVVTVHGLDVFSTRQVPGWFSRGCFERSQAVYVAAARVICISQRVALAIREKMGESPKIDVVYNGVDPELFVPEADHEPSIPSVLSVGNLIATKGHDLLLRAVARIAQSHPRIECRIIGDGPERTRLQTLARDLRIEGRVEFLGRRPRREVARAIRESMLFALPSWYEGLGCVYLEAMSAERPAIACRGQGIEEIIRHGENGWLVEPQSVGDLATGLQTLLFDSVLRARIGRCGRQSILKAFTLQHQAQRLLALYRTCAV